MFFFHPVYVMMLASFMPIEAISHPFWMNMKNTYGIFRQNRCSMGSRYKIYMYRSYTPPI